jgi:hypothetical protein
MKVSELIEKLKQHDPEKMVVISGCEGGEDELEKIEEVKLRLNVNSEWYYGEHERDDKGECDAIFLG